MIFTAQSWSHTKLSSYEATTQNTPVFHTKVQIFTPFLRDRPLHFGHVFYQVWAPVDPFGKFFFLSVFLAGSLRFLKDQISTTNKTANYLVEKRKGRKTRQSTGRQGLTENVCKVSSYFSEKRRGLPALTKCIQLSLNQLVIHTSSPRHLHWMFREISQSVGLAPPSSPVVYTAWPSFDKEMIVHAYSPMHLHWIFR